MINQVYGGASSLFHAAVFEVFPDDPKQEIWPTIIEVLQNWILEKERRKQRANQKRNAPRARKSSHQIHIDIPQILRWTQGSRLSAHAVGLLRESIVKEIEERLKKGNVSSSTITSQTNKIVEALSIASPGNEAYVYDSETTLDSPVLSKAFATGNLRLSNPASILTTKVFDENAVPKYWAMEYIENDPKIWWRTWVTQVGVTSSSTGTYHIVARVSFNVDPTYLHAEVDSPPRNIPRFIRDLVNKEGIACIAGEDVLSNRAEYIGEEQFPELYKDIVKPIRKIPLVVVRSDAKGKFRVNPDDLAKRLTGVAIVQVLDCSRPNLNQIVEDCYFNSTNKEYVLRPLRDSVTVYFPGAATDKRGAKKVYRYSSSHLQSYGDRACDELTNGIIASAVRAFSYSPTLVSSCEDIQAIIDSQRREELATRRREMEVRGKEEQVRLRSERESFEKELNALKKKNQRYSADISKLQEMHESSLDIIDGKNQIIDDLSEYATLLENEIEEASKKNALLKRENDEIWAIAAENEQHKWKAQSLQSQLLDSQKRSRKAAFGIEFRDVRLLPESVHDSLLLASKVFADKIIVHKEAFSSAKAHDSGNAGEAWEIMYWIATVLFPIAIGGEAVTEGNLPQYFQQKTGYELSLREKKATSENSALRKLREREYRGRTYDITPHIKGKSGKRSEPLRVHYCPCPEEGKILIGHCGAHMETAGTRRKSL